MTRHPSTSASPLNADKSPVVRTVPDAPGASAAPAGVWAAASEEQLRQTQKLAAMGTMAAMLAHEFNNILTRILNHADHALNYAADAELTAKALRRIHENAGRAAEISRSIFDFAGSAEDRRRPVNLALLAREAINCLGRDPAKDNIAIRCRIAPDLVVLANATLLQQVLFNLVLNARQAILSTSRRGGQLTLAADRHADGRVVIRVNDTGCGIPPANLANLFEPFFSTKTAAARSDRKGIGLGLAICRSIIVEHGGAIEVDSVLGEGTTFTITLPGN